jgi:hypothetical protein
MHDISWLEGNVLWRCQLWWSSVTERLPKCRIPYSTVRKLLQSRLSSMGKVRSYGTSSEAEPACQSSSAPAADRHGPDQFAVTGAMVLYLQNCPQGQSSGPAANALLPVLHAATFSHVILHNFAHQWVSACVDRGQDIEIPDLHVSRVWVSILAPTS